MINKHFYLLWFCLLSTTSFGQSLWTTSDYEYNNIIVLRNLIDYNPKVYNEYGGQGVYYFYDELGDKIITTAAEYYRKEILGYRTVKEFLDSCRASSSGASSGYRITIELDEKMLSPGNVDSSLLVTPTTRDSITHDPFDEAITRTHQAQRLYQRYLPYSIPKEYWVNIRHIKPEYLNLVAEQLGFKEVLPVGIAVYQMKVDTSVFPIPFYHLYFKQPEVIVEYRVPCMFRNTVDFQTETINFDGGQGQYVYYDRAGYPRVITKTTYGLLQIQGVLELKIVRAEYYQSKTKKPLGD